MSLRPVEVQASKSLHAAIAPFRKPIMRRSVIQIVNTVVPLVASWVLAYVLWPISIAASLACAVVLGLVSVRLFVLGHDAGHSAFFTSRKANETFGFWAHALVYTPFSLWRHGHALHHAHSADVAWAGVGYFWTMTLQQYRQSPWWTRLGYRAYRHPIVLFGIGGFWLFAVQYRITPPGSTWEMRRHVWGTNLLWAALVGGLCLLVDPWAVLAIQLTSAYVAMTLGLWLFYAQHHYEDAYWGQGAEWNYDRSAIEGSSYLDLPAWLHWVSANIGYHHVHHISPKVPNYRLAECHAAVPQLAAVEPLTVRQAVRGMTLTLVDTDTLRLVGFDAVRQNEASPIVAPAVVAAPVPPVA